MFSLTTLTRYDTRLNLKDVIPYIVEQSLICSLVDCMKQNFFIYSKAKIIDKIIQLFSK